MVKTSSIIPHFICLSWGVLALIEGLPLTSISQGLKLSSIRISKPYS